MITLIPQEETAKNSCGTNSSDQQPGTELMRMEAAAVDLSANVNLLGAYLSQLGGIIRTMQLRMDEIEAQQRTVSITHQDVQSLHKLIRMRAGQLCDKYGLTTAADERAIKNAIKRDILTKTGIKDLHDLPAVALPGVRRDVDRWSSIRLIMQRRALQQDPGP